ncbi:VacJ Surface lipoprotein [Oxalobacteraceae bacterium]
MTTSKTIIRWVSIALMALLLTACASVPPGSTADPRDPFERYNRAMFSFNKTVDDKVLKPVATGYVDVIPDLVRTAISNFFGNIGDVWTAVNNYLQGKPREGTNDLARVVLNSTFGIVGLIDVATPAGLVQHEEDFGQTLGVWGVKSGPYLVLPILGASTVRDGLARPVDLYADPITQIDSAGVENSLRALRLVDDRATLLYSTRMMEDAALDPYLFVRDAYLQRRESRVRDGKQD